MPIRSAKQIAAQRKAAIASAAKRRKSTGATARQDQRKADAAQAKGGSKELSTKRAVAGLDHHGERRFSGKRDKNWGEVGAMNTKALAKHNSKLKKTFKGKD